MRTTTVATLIAAVLLSVPAGFAAAESCDYTEVVAVEGVASAGFSVCEETDTWTIDVPGPGVPEVCQDVPALPVREVPEVRVLGQPVPGTGEPLPFSGGFEQCVGPLGAPGQEVSEDVPAPYVLPVVNEDPVRPGVGPGTLCFAIGGGTAVRVPGVTCVQHAP